MLTLTISTVKEYQEWSWKEVPVKLDGDFNVQGGDERGFLAVRQTAGVYYYRRHGNMNVNAMKFITTDTPWTSCLQNLHHRC